jgi:UDP-GlcNAc:undecaprenyl-phosphate GlcNAc-1-phosphate transferase
MGDAGSLGVGFVLAFLGISLTQSAATPVKPAIPLIILGLPLIDAVRVVSRRMIEGRDPFLPDMNHVYHKFLNLGFRHRFTVLAMYMVCFFWAVLSIVLRQGGQPELLALLVVVSAGFYFALRYIMPGRVRLSFLKKVSLRAVRESVAYRRVACVIKGIILYTMLTVQFILVVRGYCCI